MLAHVKCNPPMAIQVGSWQPCGEIFQIFCICLHANQICKWWKRCASQTASSRFRVIWASTLFILKSFNPLRIVPTSPAYSPPSSPSQNNYPSRISHAFFKLRAELWFMHWKVFSQLFWCLKMTNNQSGCSILCCETFLLPRPTPSICSWTLLSATYQLLVTA